MFLAFMALPCRRYWDEDAVMRTVTAAVLLGAMAASALPAQETAPPAAANPATDQASEKQICRRMQVTGSMLGGKRTCHTKAEWLQIDKANQDAYEQARRARGVR